MKTALVLLALCALSLTVQSAHAAPTLYVRVNQVGYRSGDPKVAYILTFAALDAATVTLKNSAHETVYQAIASPTVKWSAKFPFVYQFDFSSVQTADTYTVELGAVSSPPFRIDTGANLYAALLANARKFYLAQRDGSDVDNTVLSRQPSHLNDAQASIYRTPKYIDVDGSSILQGDLERIGGPMDASGGWFDAGDYLKFVQTTSFTTGLMLFAVRESPTAASVYSVEARVGVDWLSKMWDAGSKTLYYQVGIGDGNGDTILGDHDLWRLPQFDDTINLYTNPEWKYVKNRPVLRAGKPNAPISPNLAGRLAAAFALCYQVYRVSAPQYASACLHSAEQIFDLAKTQNVGQLLTAAPYDFYPETAWRDDMEWGGVELYSALAAATPPNDLPHTDPLFYLNRAAMWAKKYNAHFDPNNYDTLNLYDVGGLAHYELYRALGAAGHPNDLAVSQTALLNDLRNRVVSAAADAGNMPFGLGMPYDFGDAVPHALGLMLMTSWYQELSGNIHTLDNAEQKQVNWVLGANPWGSSFVIGAGTTFPHCPQHQIANLAGALDGSSPILLGGVVDGPSDKTEFKDLGLPGDPTTPNACPSDGMDVFKPFTGKGVRYKDDAGAWMSVEPTLDYTILAVLTFARQIDY